MAARTASMCLAVAVHVCPTPLEGWTQLLHKILPYLVYWWCEGHRSYNDWHHHLYACVISLSYECSEPNALPISALEERGLDELRKSVEEEIVKSTGKHILSLIVNLSTPQLRWEVCLSIGIIYNDSMCSKCASPSTVGCTRKPLFRTWTSTQTRARLSSRS